MVAVSRKLKVCAGLVSVALGCAAQAAQATPPEPAADAPVFATVNGEAIPVARFFTAVQEGVRRKFYHGTVPERQLAEYQREVGKELVERVLLVQEARKRKIAVDPSRIEDDLAALDAKNRGRPGWEQAREAVLGARRTVVEEDLLIEELRERTESRIGQPTPAQLQKFYEANLDLFTEPAKVGVSMILLHVDPWRPPEVWEETREHAATLVAGLRAGGDFAALARKHSKDEVSAEKGGDMGLLHKGILGPLVQDTLDKLNPGEVADPVRLLQGIAIFRLDREIPAQQVSLDSARERAVRLWQRQQREQAWKDLVAGLRKNGKVTVNERLYLPLPASEPAPAQAR